jgi:hypothetical protein
MAWLRDCIIVVFLLLQDAAVEHSQARIHFLV